MYDEVSRELYSTARTSYNNQTSEFEDWQMGNIGFLASYNGRWFDGGFARAGYEKTKNGLRYRDYYREAKDNILKQAPDLKDTIFECMDYRESVKNVSDKTLIYCDIPYANTKQYKNATKFDYEYFWNWARDMSKTCIILVSEQSAPDDIDCIWEQEVSRSIKATDKSVSKERLYIRASFRKEESP